MNIAVILAGGTGSRVGFDIPKQFVEIYDKPMIVHCIEVFQKHPEIDGVVLVCIKEYIDKMKELTVQYKLDKVMKIVNGGPTFMDSCKNGVYSLKDECSEDDIVLVTSGDRPLISKGTVSKAISVCKEKGNAMASSPCSLCICATEDQVSSTQLLVRDGLRMMATPWVFKYGMLYDVLKKNDAGIIKTDEPYPYALLLQSGQRIYFSENNSENIKVTFKEDFKIAEILMSNRKME